MKKFSLKSVIFLLLLISIILIMSIPILFRIYLRRAVSAELGELNSKQGWQNADLPFAIHKHDIELMEKLINEGHDVNGKDSDGYTMLTLACYVYWPRDSELVVDNIEGKSRELRYKMLKLLLENGANPNTLDASGRAPLHHLACRGNDNEAIRLLIVHGADVNLPRKGGYGETPLHSAIYYQVSVEISGILIESGANVNAKNEMDETPLDWALKASPSQEKADFLKKFGAKTSEELKN